MLGVGKSRRLTFERFLPMVPASHIFIVTNTIYKDLIKEQIPEIGDSQILCEPSRNNTGPSVAYTAFKLAALDPEACFLLASSDHVILKEQVFLEKAKAALDFAAHNHALVTIGLEPSRPDTGYGYIQFGEKATTTEVRKVVRFTEILSLPIATEFVESGEYLWNAGIFAWSVESILKAYHEFAPEISATSWKKGQRPVQHPAGTGFYK